MNDVIRPFAVPAEFRSDGRFMSVLCDWMIHEWGILIETIKTSVTIRDSFHTKHYNFESERSFFGLVAANSLTSSAN